jgi:nucleoside-diphosphate-sugar epimerase
MSLQGQTVLVTGAAGFIGARLVEHLVLGQGAHVRALVHRPTRAPRIGRLDVQILAADVTDRTAMVAAARGCTTVFHCAYGSAGTPEARRRVTVEGTAAAAQAAVSAGARLVHLSTLSVYGLPRDGPLDENSPRQAADDEYSRSKLKAEELVLGLHRRQGLPVAVIQPTVVYGPFGGWWTTGQLQLLQRHRLALAGNGYCHAVYVDDVVQALLLAATRDQAIGQAFLVSAAQSVSWREFYAAYEAMLCQPAVLAIGAEEALAEVRRRARAAQPLGLCAWTLQVLRERPDIRARLARHRWLGPPYRVARALLPARWRQGDPPPAPARPGTPSATAPKPLYYGDEFFVATCVARCQISIDKARRLLGYQPQFDLAAGMERTGAWARWAGLV